MADFRIDTGFFTHIKTKRLRKRLGLGGVFALQMLWAYAAQHEHEQGRVYTKEDIELAVDWDGGDDLVETLASIGFLDAIQGGYSIHEWEIHNGYAATAAKRSEAGRTAAKARWEKRRQCDGNANASQGQSNGNAPFPAPVPAPFPSPAPSPVPAVAGDERAGENLDSSESKPPIPPGQALPEYSMEFEQLWDLYPRKEAKESAWIAFKAAKAAHTYPGNPVVMPVIAQHLDSPRWQEDGGKYIPMLANWINGKRWEDQPTTRRELTPEEKAAKDAEEMRKIRAQRSLQ